MRLANVTNHLVGHANDLTSVVKHLTTISLRQGVSSAVRLAREQAAPASVGGDVREYRPRPFGGGESGHRRMRRTPLKSGGEPHLIGNLRRFSDCGPIGIGSRRGRLSYFPPTPPDMRVRIRRFGELRL